MKKIVTLFCLVLISGLSATERTITSYFEVEEYAVNRIIAQEYDPGSFEYSGTVGSYTYHLMMGQPEVNFEQNQMNMQATLTAETNVGNYSWTISPSIYVNYSISISQVIALLESFPAYVNTYLANAPQWLRDVIISHYEDLELTVYPAKVLDYTESMVPDYIAFSVKDVTVSVQSLPEVLQIGLGIVVEGTPASFTVETRNQTKLRISSNVETTVKKVQIYATQAGEIWSNSNSVTIPQNGSYTYSFPDLGVANTQGGRTIRIYFENPYNQLVRIYDCYYLWHNNEWIAHPYLGGIN